MMTATGPRPYVRRVGLVLTLALVGLVLLGTTEARAASSSGAYVVTGSGLFGGYVEAHWYSTLGSDAIAPGDSLTFQWRFEQFLEYVVMQAGACPMSEAFDPHTSPLYGVDLAKAWTPITYPFEAPFGATTVPLSEGDTEEDSFVTVEECIPSDGGYVATLRAWDVRIGRGTMSADGTALLAPACYYIAPFPPSIDPYQPHSEGGTFAAVSVGGEPCPEQTGGGALVAKKVVVNNDGGTATAGDFSFSVDGGSATGFDESGDADGDPLTGQNSVSVYPGTHSVTESAVPGYSTTYENCTDIEVDSGEAETCTITNDDIAPTLTVIKHVINNNGGSLEASDFDITVVGSSVSTGSTTFSGKESPGTTLTLDAGMYSVMEATTFADFYAASFSADCSGTLSAGDVKTCTITNDDRQRNQPSIQIKSLSVNATRTDATGVFNITDESSSGTAPDGFRILLTAYGVRWEFKGAGKKATFQPVAGMTCAFQVQSIDGVPGGAAGYVSGDPITFDETVNISYSCAFNPELALHGTLRGTAVARISGRPEKEFRFSSTVSF
jgi:Prealbumin-like fold domain